MVSLRIASPDDAEELLNIYKYYVENTAITFEFVPPTVEEFRNRIKNTLENYPYIIAMDGDKTVGYAYASRFKVRPAYNWAIETSIYIRRDARRVGIGKLLYEKLEDVLRLQQIHNVNACIISADNETEKCNNNSIRFHTHMGYQMVGKFHKIGCKFNEWYDMVWMEKEILSHDEPPKDFIPFAKIQEEVKKQLADYNLIPD